MRLRQQTVILIKFSFIRMLISRRCMFFTPIFHLKTHAKATNRIKFTNILFENEVYMTFGLSSHFRKPNIYIYKYIAPKSSKLLNERKCIEQAC